MPKPIKKRIAKQYEMQTEEEVRSMLSHMMERARENSRQLTIALIVTVVIVGALAGGYLYKKTQTSKALAHEYAGYKLYYGLYDKQGAVKSQRLADAVEEFKKAADIRKTPVSLYYIGSSYFSMGKYADAVTAMESMLAAFPNDKQFGTLARYRIATAKLRLGRTDEALKEFETIFNESPSYRDIALAESAQVLIDLGRKQEAKAKYEELIKQFPDSVYAEQANMFVKNFGQIANLPTATGAASIPATDTPPATVAPAKK